jgi:hypothetical protein
LTQFFIKTPPSVSARDLSQYEYWFDEDYSNAVVQTVAAGQTVFNFDAPSQNLPDGIHLFHFRVKDNAGIWSSPLTQFFIKTPPSVSARDLTAYEYWFDEDYSNAVVQTVAAGQTVFNFDAPSQNLPDGIHLFHFRVKDNAGIWSSPLTQFFIKTTPSVSARDLSQYEYWFDEDYSNAVVQTVAAGQTVFNFDAPSQNLPDGIHLFHFRVKDNAGIWSSPLTQFFIKTTPSVSARDLSQYEYWFDEDHANAVVQTVATGQTVFNFDAPSQNLPDGIHLFHFRVKDNAGVWSSPLTQFFVKAPYSTSGNNIVAYEYWFDNDYSTAQNIAVSAPSQIYQLNTNLTANLPQGFHKLYIRFKDAANQWSNISVHPFSNFKRGVTVIVHGFALDGGFPSDWVRPMADAITERVRYGAIIYKNDPQTGKWLHEWGDPTDTTREIILMYDWADLSNHRVLLTNFDGNGYLEAAADNLFSMLMTVPVSLGGSTKILDRPLHFIGHSRGTILCLQVFHRLKKYFPRVDIEQFTTLDPHPASVFGDILSTMSNAPNSLPLVKGFASVCTFGCDINNSIAIQIPDNVLTSDSYYRQSPSSYEGVFNKFAFSGVYTEGLQKYNRLLNNDVMHEGSSVAGGAHSAVHLWYRGTIDKNLIENNTSWYTSANTTFLGTEGRMGTGFAFSRLGGISYPDPPNSRVGLTEMENALIARTGFGLKPVFNGNFNYGDGAAGWVLNGGQTSWVNITGNQGRLQRGIDGDLKHSFFYFAPQTAGTTPTYFKWLKFRLKTSSSSRNISLLFSTPNSDVTSVQRTLSLPNTDTWYSVYCEIPPTLQGQVGTFEIKDNDLSIYAVYVDDFEFTNETPTGIIMDNTALSIELLSFEAKLVNQDAQLTWQTSSEKNASHFEIERSADGKTFEKIGAVKAVGTSNSQQKYQFLDKNLPPQYATYYYRLRMIDLDKTGQLSKVEAVNFDKTAQFDVSVYPNPTTGIITVKGSTTRTSATKIQVVNAIGQVVYQNEEQLSSHFSTTIDLSAQTTGVYWLLVRSSVGTKTEKIVLIK